MEKVLTCGAMAAVLLCAAACSSKTEAPKEPVVADLTSTPWQLEGDPVIGRPLSLTRAGDYFVVTDNKADSVYHLISIPEATYIGQFGRIGQGPGDFSNVTLVSSAPGKGNSFRLLDGNSHTYYDAKIDASGHPKYTQLTKFDNAWFVAPLANGDYVTTNGYVEWPELFTVYSADGTLRYRGGDRMVPEEHRDVAPVHQTAAYQYNIQTSPDGKHLVAVGSGEAAGFYRLENDSLVLVSQFADRFPDHVFENGIYYGQRVSKGAPQGFVDSSCTDDAVYILCSDRPVNMPQEQGDNYSGNIIYVFDWDGNKTAEYHLDKYVRLISAPDASGRIYAVHKDLCDPEFIYFTLP